MNSWTLLFSMALAGCGLTTNRPGKGDETGDSATDDTAPPAPRYPDGDRILLFHGHGGASGASSGFGRVTSIDAHWKETYGWNTDWRTSLGDDLSAFRLVGFMAPGLEGGDPFTDEELALLRGALEAGTRLLVMNEVGSCGSPVIDALLEGLGVGLRFTGEGRSEYSVVTPDWVGGAQFTEGVNQLVFSDPCYVDAGAGGSPAVQVDGDLLVAWERPGNGGDVVVVGDFEFLDDSGMLAQQENQRFADLLVEVEPGYGASGD